MCVCECACVCVCVCACMYVCVCVCVCSLAIFIKPLVIFLYVIWLIIALLCRTSLCVCFHGHDDPLRSSVIFQSYTLAVPHCALVFMDMIGSLSSLAAVCNMFCNVPVAEQG